MKISCIMHPASHPRGTNEYFSRMGAAGSKAPTPRDTTVGVQGGRLVFACRVASMRQKRPRRRPARATSQLKSQHCELAAWRGRAKPRSMSDGPQAAFAMTTTRGSRRGRRPVPSWRELARRAGTIPTRSSASNWRRPALSEGTVHMMAATYVGSTDWPRWSNDWDARRASSARNGCRLRYWPEQRTRRCAKRREGRRRGCP